MPWLIEKKWPDPKLEQRFQKHHDGNQVTEAEICNIASAVCQEFHSSDAESGALLKRMDHLKKTGHASRVFADFEAAGLTADIKETFVNIGWQHPVLTFRNIISCLSRNNKLDLIVPHGLDVFETFWDRFRGLEPGHPIFDFTAEQRRRTIPVYIHAEWGNISEKTGNHGYFCSGNCWHWHGLWWTASEFF